MKTKPFHYNPTRFCEFSIPGEKMVEETLKVPSRAPNFAFYFDKIYPIDQQSTVAQDCFKFLGEQKRALDLELKSIKPKGKPYYETVRKYGRLIPTYYKRTEAPRLSVPGTTFHGMKKDLLLEILKSFSLISAFVFIDVDMSAAHSRIARYLLSNPNSVMGLSLNDANFWETQVNSLKFIYEEKKLSVPPKIIKKILKVGLYTSLNGGNPVSDARLPQPVRAPSVFVKVHDLSSINRGPLDNLILNAATLFPEMAITKEDLPKSALFESTKYLLQNFQPGNP